MNKTTTENTTFQPAILGVGGYATWLLKYMSRLNDEGLRLVHAVVRSPAKYPAELEQLKQLHPDCDVLPDLNSLLTAEPKPDLIILPVGIQHHAAMTIQCLEAGFPVLVEKPVAATIQDVDAMIAAATRTGLPVFVGFQDIYSPSIRRIKALVAEGAIGKPLRGRAMVRWPRGEAYFKRNNWAGKLKSEGEWVLDSVLNNATAHFFNILLNLMGEGLHEATTPLCVESECYRAYDIETFDTVCLRLKLREGGVIHYYATHASEENLDPVLEVEYEKAIVKWTFAANVGTTVVMWKDGAEERFDNGPEHPAVAMLRDVRNKVEHKNEGCATLANSRVHTLIVNALSEGRDHVVPLKEGDYLKTGDPEVRYIPGLDALMEKAYAEGKLFSQCGVHWAQQPQIFGLMNYTHFPFTSL